MKRRGARWVLISGGGGVGRIGAHAEPGELQRSYFAASIRRGLMMHLLCRASICFKSILALVRKPKHLVCLVARTRLLTCQIVIFHLCVLQNHAALQPCRTLV